MSKGLMHATGGTDIQFRRTDHDRRAPREVVTARLMGDPAPDRLERAAALMAKCKPPREVPDCPSRWRP